MCILNFDLCTEIHPSLRNRREGPNVPLHANRIVAIVHCQNHCGKQLVHLTHHLGSTQVPKKVLYHRDFWGAQPPSKARARHFHPLEQCGTFPKRSSLPYLDVEILSVNEEDFSSIRDGFSVWVKTDPETILRRHVDDAKGFSPAFREAPAKRYEKMVLQHRKYSTSSTGIQDPDAEKNEPSKSTLRANGSSSLYCKHLNILIITI